jgi:hypothetical protein
LLAGARGFYLSLLERVFHVKILCLRAVITFSFFVIAYRFYNTTLEDMQSSKVHRSSQITRVNRDSINDESYKGNKGGEGTRLYSFENEFIQSSEIPR